MAGSSILPASSSYVLKELVQKYKVLLDEKGFADEKYKWQLLRDMKGVPNPDASDFKAETDKFRPGNLTYQMAAAVMRHLGAEDPEAYRAALRRLFDGQVELEARTTAFYPEIERAYRVFVPEKKFGHHQDERTMSVLLTFHDPAHYTYYKDSYYKQFCKLLGVAHEARGAKYAHYMALVTAFAEDYLRTDLDLLVKAKAGLGDLFSLDPNLLLLAQDILYRMLEQGEKDRVPLKTKTISPANDAVSNPPLAVNRILYGPPGTGKTFHSLNMAFELLGLPCPKDPAQRKKQYEDLMAQGRIALVTFHQSFAYEDFVEGIKPVALGGNEGSLGYEVQAGVFKQMCDLAAKGVGNVGFDAAYSKFAEDVEEMGGLELKTPSQGKPFRVLINRSKNAVAIPYTVAKTEMVITKQMILNYLLNGEIRDWKPYTVPISEYVKANYQFGLENTTNTQPYVLIIDEVNRGNVSQILGELITLIEPNKRAGQDEALSAILPYSKEPFSVPSNLHIIGTMNTADRSVEALDTALRRRFEFVEMPPQPELLRADDDDNDSEINWLEVEGFVLKDILQTLNERLEQLLDKDHLIGHAFFMGLKGLTGEEGVHALRLVFADKIIPLLKEYFYGDLARMGLVLGAGFIKEKAIQRRDLFADFKHPSMSDFLARSIVEVFDFRENAADAQNPSDLNALFLSALGKMMRTE